jgi:hypothetical protein
MPQPGVQLFDMKNAIVSSDTLALARIVEESEARFGRRAGAF